MGSLFLFFMPLFAAKKVAQKPRGDKFSGSAANIAGRDSSHLWCDLDFFVRQPLPHCEILGNRVARSRRVKKRRPFDCFKSA